MGTGTPVYPARPSGGGVVTSFDEVLRGYRVTRVELTAWISEAWVTPQQEGDAYVFDEADLARVELIRDLRLEMAVNDDALPVVLSLLDQLYAARRVLGRLDDVLRELPAGVREQIRAKLET